MEIGVEFWKTPGVSENSLVVARNSLLCPGEITAELRTASCKTGHQSLRSLMLYILY